MAPANFEAFIRETRHELKKVVSILENGRDRLLELHSFNNDVAEGIIQEMKKIEQEKHFNPLVKELFGLFGVRLEASDHYIYHVNFELLEYPDFPIPVFREGYLRATFDRRTAVIHEDVEFLSWDHPMVTGTVDLLLGSEKGNASIVSWKDADSDEMLLEAIFILGCTAPPSMHVERFFPPIPIRIVVNHLMKNRTENYTSQYISSHIREGVFNDRIKGREMKDLISGMIKQANIYSGKYVEQVIKLAVDKMEKVLQNEIHRLVYLKTINPNVRGEEIRILEIEKKELKRAILKAQPRLDALRLIVHF